MIYDSPPFRKDIIGLITLSQGVILIGDFHSDDPQDAIVQGNLTQHLSKAAHIHDPRSEVVIIHEVSSGLPEAVNVMSTLRTAWVISGFCM